MRVAMTQPRRIVPGETYLITRRVFLRTFLLAPTAAVNEAFEYCLAEAAERHNIDVIAWLVMSNHYHAVVHDPDGVLPAFLERFHKMVAKVLNVHHRRREAFWSSEETCVTRLVTPDDVVDKVVYVLTNPVSANLVETVATWPGSSAWGRINAEPTVVKRPAAYFSEKGVMPTSAKLSAVVPRGLKGQAAAQWVDRVERAVAAKERAVAAKRNAKKLGPALGVKAVLRTDAMTTPSTDETLRKLRPALACKDPDEMKRARLELRGFRAQYHEMLTLLRADKVRLSNGKDRLAREKPVIVFPAGTYRLRVVFGVPCDQLAA
jgi:putative transposase